MPSFISRAREKNTDLGDSWSKQSILDRSYHSIRSLSSVQILNKSFHGTRQSVKRPYSHEPITQKKKKTKAMALKMSENDWTLSFGSSSYGTKNSDNTTDSESDNSETNKGVFENLHKVIDIEGDFETEGNKDKSFDIHRSKAKVDCDILRSAIYETGKWSEGIIAIEVWVHTEDKHTMVPRGHWLKDGLKSQSSGEALNLIANKKEIGYIPPAPHDNGTGIACVLLKENPIFNKNTTWTELSNLEYDSQDKLRCSLLAKAGIGIAAGSPFEVNGHSGIVVFMAKPTVNMEKLRSKTNIAYMRSAADIIGTASENAELRLKLLHERQESIKNTAKNSDFDVEHDALVVRNMYDDFDYDDIEDVERVNIIKDSVLRFAKKFRGGPDKPPPEIPKFEALWVCLGVFVTMFAISSVSQKIMHLTDGDLLIEMGPLGALMILQFGLSAVPAAQPYNAVFGQMTSAVISMLVARLPLELPLKIALAVSLSCSVMIMLGFTHPPAGAAAVIFSTKKYSWASCGLLVVGTIMAVVFAAIWNNMYANRSYPAYWGLENFRNLRISFYQSLMYLFKCGWKKEKKSYSL